MRGVLVLIDNARLPMLATLTRALLTSHPKLSIHTNAFKLAELEEGSIVILIPDPKQAEWLNFERPLFAELNLRLLIFSDASTSKALAQRAPDFFSWISHRIECPEAPPAHVIQGIRRAFISRAYGIAFRGKTLETSFQAALPGRPLRYFSANLDYKQLVAEFKPKGREWVGVRDIDGEFEFRRVLWAMAEAGRRSRVILIEPHCVPDGFWPIHDRLQRPSKAIDQLHRSGAQFPGRLAALSGFEPEALNLLSKLLRSGENESFLEDRLRNASDSGAELGKLALQKTIVLPRPSPPLLRAIGKQAMHISDEMGTGIAQAIWAGGTPWHRLAHRALFLGVPEVGLHWALRSVREGNEHSHEALLVLGKACEEMGLFDQAERVCRSLLSGKEGELPKIVRMWAQDRLASVLLKYKPRDKEIPRLFAEVRAFVSAHAQSAIPDEFAEYNKLSSAYILLGRNSVGRANELVSEKRLEEAWLFLESKITELTNTLMSYTHPLIAECENNLAHCLGLQGRHKEAYQWALESYQMSRKIYRRNIHPHVAASTFRMADALRGKGHFEKAKKLAENALKTQRRIYRTRIHFDVASTLQLLGFLELNLGNIQQAERYLETSLRIYIALHKSCESIQAALAMQHLGTARLQAGKSKQAQVLFEKALELFNHFGKGKESTEPASLLIQMGQLARVDGQLDLAEEYYQQAITTLEKLSDQHPRPELPAALQWLAGVRIAKADLFTAHQLMELALALAQQIHDYSEHPEIWAIESRLGALLIALNQHERASELLSHAFLKSSERLGMDHSLTQAISNNLAALHNPLATLPTFIQTPTPPPHPSTSPAPEEAAASAPSPQTNPQISAKPGSPS